MSYIEKKYKQKINKVFAHLPSLENDLLELLKKSSITIVDDIATICAKFNKKINLILKKYYPEIKEVKDKLDFKPILKFYYELIDRLTDLVRNIENFQKIDDKYYDELIEFIESKESLISGKYRTICSHELTAFYDPLSRANLEKIISEKFLTKSKQFFTFGSLEEEIKKIAKIAGAKYVSIIPADETTQVFMSSANSVISYTTSTKDEKIILNKIGNELKKLLESKKYHVVIKANCVITNAKLLLDEI